MQVVRQMMLFTQNNLKQFKRKWTSLPLLLLFPALFIGLLALLAFQLLSPEKADPIQAGLVDLDQSDETRMMLKFMENSEQMKGLIRFRTLTEQEARQQLQANKLSAYVRFPEQFAQRLRTGNPVILDVTGNEKDAVKAKLVDTFVQSAATHINAAQANILTIDEYAEALGLEETERRALVKEQFKSFLFFTLGKDQAIEEEQLVNQAASSPGRYYALAGWFAAATIWLFACYRFLSAETPAQLYKRMTLYGVTRLRQIASKSFAAFIPAAGFTAAAFMLLLHYGKFAWSASDLAWTAVLFVLYSFLFLFSLGLIELVIPSEKLGLTVQIVWMICLLGMSGAAIPLIYFPESVQHAAEFLFSTKTFSNLSSIYLDGKTTELIPLLPAVIIVSSLLLAISSWKERSV